MATNRTRLDRRMRRLGVAQVALSIGALAAIAYGAWLVYRPAAPIAIGMLLWIDLARRPR
jgi:hypothetical protein